MRKSTQKTPWNSWLIPKRLLLGMLAVATFGGPALDRAAACETPVYRYAMYRWQPAPYEIYCFHEVPLGDAYHEVKAAVDAVTETSDEANLVLLPVDVAEDPELLGVPVDVKQAWQAGDHPPGSGYLISTPYGVSLHRGELSPEQVAKLADSPARKSLAAQLEVGKVGVFLLLTCSDEAANTSARETIQGLVDEVAAGDVDLYTPPGTEPEEANTAGKSNEVGLLEIARNSEEEGWLVKSLLSVEPDLAADDQPMAFLVYGRARTLLPYIGKGISRENLLREIEFISGACSCTVKEQNPGVDLLVRYDWESAAAALAERVGSEEGNESAFGTDSFFPELIIPSANQVNAESPADQPVMASAVAEPASDVTEVADAASDGTPSTGDVAASTSADDTDTADMNEADADRTVAAVEPVSEGAASAAFERSSSGMTFGVVAIGLVAALVVLFGVTLVVLRPQ